MLIFDGKEMGRNPLLKGISPQRTIGQGGKKKHCQRKEGGLDAKFDTYRGREVRWRFFGIKGLLNVWAHIFRVLGRGRKTCEHFPSYDGRGH